MNRAESYWKSIFVQLWRNRTSACGLCIVSTIVLIVAFAPLIYPCDPGRPNFGRGLTPPSSENPLGTDALGRDLLSRIIFGGRISMIISFLAISLATCLGVSMGLTAGYFGGRIDSYVMRGIDALLAFPDFVLALALTASLGFGMHNMIIAMGIAYTPNFCRIVRGCVLSIKEQQYVEAAESIGAKKAKIMFSEILPNCLAPVIVQATVALGFVILMEAGLSFLGIGIQPPAASWGSILADGREQFGSAPWIVTFTGIIITITIIGINLLGDGLRDALDPRLRLEIK